MGARAKEVQLFTTEYKTSYKFLGFKQASFKALTTGIGQWSHNKEEIISPFCS